MDHGGRRFLIDASMIHSGGGFTFAVNVVPRLARDYPGDAFRVFARSERLADSLGTAPNMEVVRLPPPSPWKRFHFTYIEGPRIAKEWGADVYFSSGDYAPLRASCPIVASFQNPNVFTPLRQGWSWKQSARLKLLRGLAGISARTADRIHFVSEDSSRWIGDSIGLPVEKRAWIHHGIDADEWRPTKPRTGGKLGDQPYILSVSSVYRYKNYVRLIEAFADLARRNPEVPDLVIIGADLDPPYTRQMHAAREATGDLAEHIHLLGEVPYADIRRYYQEASLVVFPSYLETFGIPVIEALASDVPLVASDIPIFREIAGDAAFYADPYRPESLADAMQEALSSETARDTLVKRGRERISRFTWDHAAAQLMGVFESVIEDRGAPAPQPILATPPLRPSVALSTIALPRTTLHR
jgi:glycosyltransferase involved in cell wall biosynthesis